MQINYTKINQLLLIAFLVIFTSLLSSCNSGTTSSDKAITSYSLNDESGVINGSNIAVTVPYGTNTSNLIANFTTTGQSVMVGSVNQVSDVTANNFANPVVYKVIAEDGTTSSYTVTVTVIQPSDKAITAYSLNGHAGVISDNNIAVSVPYGTDPTKLVATFTTTGQSVSVGDKIQVSSVTENNFTQPVVYTVTALDGTATNYTVTVTVTQPSDKAITSYSLNGHAGVINGNSILVAMPHSTDATSLTATFTTTGADVAVNGVSQTNGDTINNFTQPVVYTVTALDGTTAQYTVTVTVGQFYNIQGSVNSFCALDTNGTVYCWGNNGSGQVGNGTYNNESHPTAVYNPNNIVFKSLTGFNYNFCATDESKNLYCWGGGSYGQIGNGYGRNESSPSKVQLPIDDVTQETVTFTSISIGNNSICGVGTNKHVYCWGNNQYGQIGNGTNTNALVPTQIVMADSSAESEDFVEVATNYYGNGSTCAVASSGNVYCWGGGLHGALGNGSTSNVNKATLVTMPTNGDKFKHIIGMGNGNCVLTTTNTVYCWGYNNSGEGGNGINYADILTPTAIAMPQLDDGEPESFATMTTSVNTACAISNWGISYCWGFGWNGQRGDGLTSNLNVPVKPQLPNQVYSISSSYYQNATLCAIDINHQVYCWGYGIYGQIGNGTTSDATTPMPISLSADKRINQVTLSGNSRTVCAVEGSGGDIYCWGDSSQGQLGNGSVESSSTPVLATLNP